MASGEPCGSNVRVSASGRRVTTSPSSGPVRLRSSRVCTRRVTSSISTGPFAPSRTVTWTHAAGSRAWPQTVTDCHGGFGGLPRPWDTGPGASRSRMVVVQGTPRIRARYLTARLPNPPVSTVHATFTAHGARKRDMYRKFLVRQLHGVHHGQLAHSLTTSIVFPYPLPKGLRHVRGFPALRLLCPI